MAKQNAGHPSSRPIIYQAITTILLLTPASAHLSAQQYDFAPEFGAGVEAKYGQFTLSRDNHPKDSKILYGGATYTSRAG